MRTLGRLGAASIVATFGVVAVVLLWADRGVLVGDRIVSLITMTGRWAESTFRVDLIDRSDLPSATDQLGHIVLWALGTVAIGLGAIRRRSTLRFLAAMAMVSLAFEVLQPVVSTNRGFEAGDARANLVGVMIGGLVFGAANLLRMLVDDWGGRQTDSTG